MQLDNARLCETARALIDNGLAEFITNSPLKKYAPWHARLARTTKNHKTALRKTLAQLGGGFLELGKFLRDTPDIAPQTLREELQELPKNAEQIPFAYVLSEMQREYGISANKIFKNIEENPIAQTTTTQTHIATLPDNTKSTVTVIKPNAEYALKRDFAVLQHIANAIENMPLENAIKPKQILRAYGTHLREILDLRTQLAQDAPKLHRELTTKRVLISHPLDGILTGLGAEKSEKTLHENITKRFSDSTVRIELENS